jgi:hypothetical protein
VKNEHEYIDEFKRRIANAVLLAAGIKVIRQKSLENMNRWEAGGVWVSAHDEWRDLMTNGTDADVIAVMTGRDQKATRLRQSSPFTGIVDDVTRAYLWETRQVEEDTAVVSAYPVIDAEKLQQAKTLLNNFDIDEIRLKSLYFLERLHRIAGKLSATHEKWHTLLMIGSDDEIIAMMSEDSERAKRMRLVHPFSDLL